MLINNDTLNFLNLKDTDVEECDSTTDGNTLFLNVVLKRKEHQCPSCNHKTNTIKDYSIKIISHSIFNDGRVAKIRYKQRRYICKFCKKSFIEDNPFTKIMDKVSKLVINTIIEKLKDPNITYSNVAKELNVTITTVQNIFDENVKYKRRKLPTYLCIDEFHCSNANPLTRYSCFFLDFERNLVIDVIKSRRKDYLANYLTKIPLEERQMVEHVCIDMWPTYKEISTLYFPNALISVDSFHVVKDIQIHLDSIRKRIMSKFSPNSKEYYLLKKYNWLLFKPHSEIKYNEPRYNRKLEYYVNHIQILESILKISKELNDAYEWKEKYTRFNKKCNYETAEEELKQLIIDLEHLKLLEFEPVLKTLKFWSKEIINSFIKYLDVGRIHNGKIENRNNVNKKLQKVSNGITNFERYRNRIFLCINGNKKETN